MNQTEETEIAKINFIKLGLQLLSVFLVVLISCIVLVLLSRTENRSQYSIDTEPPASTIIPKTSPRATFDPNLPPTYLEINPTNTDTCTALWSRLIFDHTPNKCYILFAEVTNYKDTIELDYDSCELTIRYDSNPEIRTDKFDFEMPGIIQSYDLRPCSLYAKLHLNTAYKMFVTYNTDVDQYDYDTKQPQFDLIAAEPINFTTFVFPGE